MFAAVHEDTTGVTWGSHGPILTLDARARVSVTKLMDTVQELLRPEAIMLPNRDHPVVDRVLVEVRIPDPVVALDFRMGYDSAALNLAVRRLSRAASLLSTQRELSPQDVDDLCAALSFCRIYLSWLTSRPGANSRDSSSLSSLHSWLGLVIDELCAGN